MPLFFVLIGLFLVGDVGAQTAPNQLALRLHQIPVKTIKQYRPEVVLGQYVGEEFKTLKALPIPEDTVATFVFTFPPNASEGLYSLFVGDKSEKVINKAEFIWSPRENLVMDAVYYQLKDGSVQIEQSAENEAYARLIALKTEYDPLFEELYQRRFALVVFDPQYKRKSDELELLTERTQLNYDNALTQLAQLFPGTYTARVLVPLSLVPVRTAREVWAKQFDSYLSFLGKYYFYHVDFNNPGILNHYAFTDKLVYYLTNYTERSTDGMERAIDVIFSKLQDNQEVNSFVFNMLLKSFIKAGSEHLVKYVLSKHPTDCALDLPFEELKKLQSIQALSLGGLAPEISLPDQQGNYQSLRAYCQKNQYTLVFFWLSWCARCQKETPRLMELHKKYQSKGLGVYSVCLDEKREDWEAALKKYNAPWLHVAELAPVSKSQCIANYSISTTPALFVLNKKGEVVQKGLFGDPLAAYLEGLFK